MSFKKIKKFFKGGCKKKLKFFEYRKGGNSQDQHIKIYKNLAYKTMYIKGLS